MSHDHTAINTEDARDRLALHEAARALCAHHFCQRVVSIGVAPMSTTLGPCCRTYLHAGVVLDEDPESVVLMAGSAAEILAGYANAPSAHSADWRAAWRNARRQGYAGVARAWHVTRCVQRALLLLDQPAYRDALDALTAALLRRADRGCDRLEGAAAHRLIAASLERTSMQSWAGCCRHFDVPDRS